MFDLEKYQFREAATTVTALAGLGIAGYQAYQGSQNAKKASQAINDYDRQDLNKSNPYENMQISTLGSDIMNEQNQINSANNIEAMRNAGSRGIAMLPSVTAQNNQANQNTRAYLDEQVQNRNYAIAGDKTAIRGMKEDRENADLAGLGQQLQTGRQDMWSGIRGVASSAMYAANNIDWNGDGETQADKDAANSGNSGISGDAFYNRYRPRYDSILSNYNKI
ncbi:MAG: hypothetical protein H7Y10_03720 [Flavobacterium sp.]|nr:hypothetical protein [Flavobacterium sp.]